MIWGSRRTIRLDFYYFHRTIRCYGQGETLTRPKSATPSKRAAKTVPILWAAYGEGKRLSYSIVISYITRERGNRCPRRSRVVQTAVELANWPDGSLLFPGHINGAKPGTICISKNYGSVTEPEETCPRLLSYYLETGLRGARPNFVLDIQGGWIHALLPIHRQTQGIS